MELLSKTNSIQHSPRKTGSGQNGEKDETQTERTLFTGLFNALPTWEKSNAIPVPLPTTSSGMHSTADVLYSNVLGQQMELATNAATSIQHLTNNSPLGNNDILFGAIGQQHNAITPTPGNNAIGHLIMNQSNKASPESNSSIICGWCEISACSRCLDCNEFMCKDCLHDHQKNPFFSNHSIVALPLPIGSSPTSASNMATHILMNSNYQCDLHNEILRYVCEFCKKLVCQCCTLREHKDHSCISIQNFVDDANDKIESALESSTMGTKCIKGSIDKALAFIRLIDRNCNEISENIRKAYRQYAIAIEDRERFLLDCVEKVRNRRLAVLHDQMAGLKSALAGLAETSEMLHKITNSSQAMDKVDIAFKITSGQRQLEQLAAIYKDLQPKQELYVFIPPDFSLMKELRSQGVVILTEEKSPPPTLMHGCETSPSSSTSSISSGGVIINYPINGPGSGAFTGSGQIPRRPILRGVDHMQIAPITPIPNRPQYNATSLDWELGNVLRTSPAAFPIGVPHLTQCIPGSLEHVKVRKSNGLTASFGLEGHDDGQVSRPWGVCVDKGGHILVSDRRNNRVQVFNPDGTLKFKFGRKGVGNGEFDLPAGICVDIDNRIIVVDKDNHRVQIFTANGVFILKFGSYGKEAGQFQYPWDVAINSRKQIVVTDSRNHRIQQFDSEGHFLRQIIFDSHGHTFKGVASPRGVCYTPEGNIIVSDFDNHCLYLINPDQNKIVDTKGQEGSNIQDFNRPSGLCCDDDGLIIVADSKNQRIMVFTPGLTYLWDVEIRPSHNALMPITLDEKDRTCDVALMPDGRIVFLIELSPDAKEGSNPHKRFIHIY